MNKYQLFTIMLAVALSACQNSGKQNSDEQADSIMSITENVKDNAALDSAKNINAAAKEAEEAAKAEEALKEEHIAFIKKFYDDFFVKGKEWSSISASYLRHCSKEIKNAVIENYDYDCETGDCYAWWIFRDFSQDSNGNIKVTVTHDHDNWYNAKYVDMRTANVKIRIEGSGDDLKITGLKNKEWEIDVK